MNDFLEKIEAFVEGSMSEDQAKEFQQLIDTDTKVSKEYHDFLSIREALESSNEEDLRQRFTKIDSEAGTESGNPHRKWWVLASILAMAIVIGVTSYVRTSSIVPQQIASDFSIFDDTENFRSEGSVAELEETAYYIPMEKANTLIQEEHYSDARSVIKGIELDEIMIVENKEWMIALTYYLENGRKDERFQSTLDKILKNPDHNCYNLAVNLDSKVNSFWGRLK